MDKLSLHKVDDAMSTDLAQLTEELLTGVVTQETQYQITLLEQKLAHMKPNMAAIAEYRKKVVLLDQSKCSLSYTAVMFISFVIS